MRIQIVKGKGSVRKKLIRLETMVHKCKRKRCLSYRIIVAPKNQGSVKKISKNDFATTEGWFHRWKKRENIPVVSHMKKERSRPRICTNVDSFGMAICYHPISFVNGIETGLYSRALSEHTYPFKN